MRTLTLALVLLLVLSASAGAADQAPRPPQAPSPPPGWREPTSTAEVSSNPITRLSQKEAYRQAIDGNKPLCIWVNYKCPSTANQLTDYVHTFARDYKDDSTPRVVVGLPDGAGWLNKAGEVRGEDCCATNVRAVAERPVREVAPAPAWGPAPTMHFAPPPGRRSFLAPAGRPAGRVFGGRGSHGACVG